MMSLILFMIGIVLYFTRRVSLGGIRAEGRQVRAAGLVLMSPTIISFVISLFAGMIFAGNLNAVVAVIPVLTFIETTLMIAAVMVAYILIAAPAGAPRLPGVLGRIQSENQPLQPIPARVPEQLPSIMNVSEAARYLQVSEADVLALIEDGKLAAARINYSYRIARRSLDELREARQTA